jgi:aspartyl aminopeptidase
MNRFLNFIKDTPTAFHAAKKCANVLKENGYKELTESSEWKLEGG